MKGIYLAAFKSYHPTHDLIYQDINGLRDIGGDMMDVDLTPYDYIIASPPCNYWSRANYRRDTSAYSLKTKHLLPSILKKLIKLDKPFIVENVCNEKQFYRAGLFNLPCFIYRVGRHTYWSNIFLCLDCKQEVDNIVHISSNKRQGGSNVHEVIEMFINYIEEL